MIEPIKAITICQPYANLTLFGAKGYETRSWPTKHRGKIAIHAATARCIDFGRHTKHRDSVVTALNSAPLCLIPENTGEPYESRLPRGCVIGFTEIKDVWRIDRLHVSSTGLSANLKSDINPEYRQISEQEFLFGEYQEDWYAWELGDIEVLETPIYVPGRQRLWNWTPNPADNLAIKTVIKRDLKKHHKEIIKI